MKNLAFPTPSPSSDYNETIEQGFKAYPKRYDNFMKYKKNPKATIPDFLPIKMDVEPLSRCNFKCDMCIVSDFENLKRAEDLNFQEFKEIIDENFGVFEIKIQGLGEPFMHKDFTKMVEYASSKKIWTRSTTNASLLHKNENYKKIIDANIGELQLSIDGCTKESYEKVRVNSNFETMVRNTKLLNEYQASVNVDKTRMWFLLQDTNFNDLYKIPEFAKELGFKRVTISLDIIGWNNIQWEEKNGKKSKANSISQKDIDNLLEIAKKININLTFWGISSKFSKQNVCPWPFERSFISSDKYIVPCCMISNPETYNFGQKKISFTEIWTSKNYIQFRQDHLDNNIPDICKFCYTKEN